MSLSSRSRAGVALGLGLVVLTGLLLGQGCPGLGGSTLGESTGEVAVSVRSPSIDRTMPPGETVTVVYDATGTTSVSAFYDHDGVAASGDEVNFGVTLGTGQNRFVQLPTSNLTTGVYHLAVTGWSGSTPNTVYAAGKVILVGGVVFTSPANNIIVGP